MLSTVNQIRSNVVDNCHWGVANAHLIGYAETRPYPRPAYHARTAFVTDCSGFVSLMAMWSRLANMQGVDIDPSGYAFDGYGNSDTIFDHLPSVELAHTWRGDLVVYGRPAPPCTSPASCKVAERPLTRWLCRTVRQPGRSS